MRPPPPCDPVTPHLIEQAGCLIPGVMVHSENGLFVLRSTGIGGTVTKEMSDVCTAHEFVDVGFHFSKWVCKKCNEEKK